MEKFCSLPWTNIDVDPQGKFRPCCKYKSALTDNLTDYLQSQELINLKKEFLENKQPEGCVRCWQDEDSGLVSKRQLESEKILDNAIGIRKLQLAFGNTCNLACRTCSSYASSKWSENELSARPSLPDLVIHGHKKFYKDSKFVLSLRENLNDLEHIEIAGGESFITGVQQQLDWLDFYINNHRSQNINLTHITNCTIFPNDDFWTRWEKFKSVTIVMSVDAVDKKFEYIRWPASWEECLKNIKQYQKFKNTKDNIKISISHTVSIFNVLDLPEFFIWCYKQGLPKPYLNMVTYPDYFSIKNLPTDAKEYITRKLGKTNQFNSVINFMNLQGSDLKSQTVNYINIYDNIRKQDFSLLFSELKEKLSF